MRAKDGKSEGLDVSRFTAGCSVVKLPEDRSGLKSGFLSITDWWNLMSTRYKIDFILYTFAVILVRQLPSQSATQSTTTEAICNDSAIQVPRPHGASGQTRPRGVWLPELFTAFCERRLLLFHNFNVILSYSMAIFWSLLISINYLCITIIRGMWKLSNN